MLQARQVACLVLLCGLAGCKSEQERREEEQAHLRSARLRRLQQAQAAEQRRRLEEQALAAQMSAGAGPARVSIETAAMKIELFDGKPSRRRNRFTFPSQLRVVGGLERRQVYRALKRRRRAIRRCVRKGWKAKPPLRGTVRIALAVSRRGDISRVEIEFGKRNHPATTLCIRTEVLRLRFPKNSHEPTLVGVSAVGRRHFGRRYWHSWRR